MMIHLCSIMVDNSGAWSSLVAYLDPGSGSMLLQLALAGVAATAAATKLYWRQVARVFAWRNRRPDGPDREAT